MNENVAVIEIVPKTKTSATAEVFGTVMGLEWRGLLAIASLPRDPRHIGITVF